MLTQKGGRNYESISTSTGKSNHEPLGSPFTEPWCS
jgi:hypothetical protein